MSKGKKIAVLGAGESGVGAAILAKKEGWEVFVSDRSEITEANKKVLYKHNIEWEEGGHTVAKILSADEVVKSPGIPDHVTLVQQLLAQGTNVISEIELAGRYTNAQMICITGSNGKTTTTLLLHHLLKRAGLNVGLAGNVGHSLARQVAEEQYDYYVVELSSFQLDGMYNFKANIAILLNITPDHLDRYEYKMENYIHSKFRITQNQEEGDAFIYFKDDENIAQTLEKINIKAVQYPYSLKEHVQQGAYIKGKELLININDTFDMSIHDLALQGKHNIANSMAAGIAARVLELRKEIIRESLSDFQNIEHRLEFVAKVHGIEFINDSKATNVNSTWYALENMTKPVIWIVGGVDKGNDYSLLTDLVKDRVKAIVCLGTDNSKIHDAFEGVVETVVDAATATEAVGMGYQLARKGEAVLLSPACASFDLFENYEDRGQQFKAAVKAL